MSRKEKRKRRSFWEPESETIVNWLNQQTDLGTSLQLIIVDAIEKYGNGDVIKAYLTRRESGLGQILRPAQVTETSPIQERYEEPRVEQRTEQPDVRREPVRESRPEVPVQQEQAYTPEPQGDVTDILLKDLEEYRAKPEQQAQRRTTRPQPVRQEPVKQKQPTQQPESQHQTELADDYDPIEVMMGDVGSRFDR